MDDQGRLHIGKFVGMSFDETGVVKEVTRLKKQVSKEQGVNRHERRRAEALARAAKVQK